MSKDDESSSNKNKTITLDPSHPFFIHYSDQPGHMLVPTKLNGTNYQAWSQAMIHALTAKSKLGFIDGSIEPPTDNASEFSLWKQCNSMILSWLNHSVEADIAEEIVHAKTAQQVWDDLRDQFSQKNAPAVYQVQKSIATISQGSMMVATYYTKIKSLWSELDTYRTYVACNQKEHNQLREEDRLMQFLMSLNDTFKTIRSNILMMTPLPNVRQAYSLIIQEETQRHATSNTTEGFTIAAAAQSKYNSAKSAKHCDHCKRSGHTIDECRTLKFHCDFCDKNGHTEDRCRLKNGGHSKQQYRGSKYTGRGNYSSSNMEESDNAPSTNLQTFSPEYLQQLAQALSVLNHNTNSNK